MGLRSTRHLVTPFRRLVRKRAEVALARSDRPHQPRVRVIVAPRRVGCQHIDEATDGVAAAYWTGAAMMLVAIAAGRRRTAA